MDTDQFIKELQLKELLDEVFACELPEFFKKFSCIKKRAGETSRVINHGGRKALMCFHSYDGRNTKTAFGNNALASYLYEIWSLNSRKKTGYSTKRRSMLDISLDSKHSKKLQEFLWLFY